MNVVDLSKLFIEYKETNDRLAALEALIQKEVLALEDSQKIAGVKATYYKPSVEVDYESAAKSKNPNEKEIEQWSTIVMKTRWKDLCEALGVTQEELKQFSEEKPARVVVKA